MQTSTNMKGRRKQHLARMLRKAGLLRIAVVSKACHAVVRPRPEGLADCADITWPQRAPYHPDCNQTLPQIPHRHNIEAPYLQYCTYRLPMNDGTEIEQQINASETVSLRCLNYLTKAYCLVRWYQVRTKYMLAKIHTILPCELDHHSSIKLSAMLSNSPASASAGLTKTYGYGTIST